MLKISKLSKSFGKKKVIKKIDLEIEKGERVVIIGPSGSGKSTLLRMINRLEKPTSGEIYYNDELITDRNIDEIRSKISMVFQQFNLFNNLSVIDNIALGPIKVKGISEFKAYNKARNLLKRFDLARDIDSYPKELSGGMKQRVGIIRSLAMEPEIILFDEPTSALDPEMVKEVVDLILDIKDSVDTMIIVSHELSFVKKVATKVVFLCDGIIEEVGTPNEIFNHPKSPKLKKFLSNFK